tara:strand:+ start:288 stop:725 length:438 start_codon:yes stop_codon:yes gene_type:complete
MKFLEEKEYKGYSIYVYEQKPSPEWEKHWETDDLRGDELGTHAYKIFNKQGEQVGIDRCCMGDEGACFENAEADIDCGDVDDVVRETSMNDEEMMKLVYSLAELDEHRRKELAILLLSTTLNPLAVEQTAGFMVGIADVVTEEKD